MALPIKRSHCLLAASIGFVLLSCYHFYRRHGYVLEGNIVHFQLSRVPIGWYSKVDIQRRRMEESSSSSSSGERLSVHKSRPSDKSTEASRTKLRILYIVTSLHEFDNGQRFTVEGYDRFSNIMLPVIVESATSMMTMSKSAAIGSLNGVGSDMNGNNTIFQNAHVDVYWIAHYKVSAQRYRQLRMALPDRIGLQVWDDATPMGYALEEIDVSASTEHPKSVNEITRALSRQHRYVIKDKFPHYDIFVNFEDDMLIRGSHVQHYIDVTQKLYELRQNAPDVLDNVFLTVDEALHNFHGPMTKTQLGRMLPGFIRVEVALPNFRKRNRNLNQQIPLDFNWDYPDSIAQPWDEQNSSVRRQAPSDRIVEIDPSICCNVPARMANEQIPAAPKPNDLLYWETSIEALGLRHMPSNVAQLLPSDKSNSDKKVNQLGWVILQAGNLEDYYEDTKYIIGEYWTGRDGAFGADKARPTRTAGRYLNNQGGWIGTRRQIMEWHVRWCMGSFLPPLDRPAHDLDGLDRSTVEFWSGGIEICGVKACNLQRIVTLDPDGFSRHLLYHVSNNKQRSANVRDQFSGRSVNQFWAQLNSIRKKAELAMKQEMAQERLKEGMI